MLLGLLGIMLSVFAWASGAEPGQAKRVVALENKHIRATFSVAGGTCRMIRLSRLDGGDSLPVASDEFEIVFFDKTRVTVDQYEIENIKEAGDSLAVSYRRRNGVAASAPAHIAVTYTLAQGPYLFKDLVLAMKENEKIDRLQVLRFSCAQTATRGGHGQPVFIGNWFFGLNYPCFHSRHSDQFVEPNFNYRWHYTVDLEGGDKEYAARPGLVSLFHFPGYAKKQANGAWGIHGKRAVIGIAAKKTEGPELGLLDYIEAYRKPSGSYLHFNNWFTPEAKNIAVGIFVDNVAAKLKTNLEKYGARLDAMVPDDGWHRTDGFKRIYESKYPLPDVGKALRKMDVDLGAWVAMDGTSTSVAAGEQVGYKAAIPQSVSAAYQKRTSFWGPQRYFNILDPRYQEDYKKAMRYLLQDSDVRYIKHDYNHMYVGNYLSERHAREACLDVTLDLMAYERQLNPKLIINFTNGSFFTPFWLLYVEYVWMNSADAANNAAVPQISKLEYATSYRDSHFYSSFNNPERTVRPILPIANFMTHGILHGGDVKYFKSQVDPIIEWLNYAVMYYGRGSLLKELYISPGQMTEAMWRALGTASAWAQKNENLMRNTVFVGGNPDKGEAYGYISWQGDKAMLTVRNPIRKTQSVTVPFDASVYYRGAANEAFRARAVYPFVEQMPWKLVSGKPFSFEVPGDSVMAFELTAGAPLTDTVVKPEPLPPVVAANSRKDGYEIKLTIPDEEFPHYELLMYSGKPRKGATPSTPLIDGVPLTPKRALSDSITLTAYDLRPYRGKTITITGNTPDAPARIQEAWLVVDRKISAPAADATHKGEVLPWSIGQDYRRLTQEIILKPMTGE